MTAALPNYPATLIMGVAFAGPQTYSIDLLIETVYDGWMVSLSAMVTADLFTA